MLKGDAFEFEKAQMWLPDSPMDLAIRDNVFAKSGDEWKYVRSLEMKILR